MTNIRINSYSLEMGNINFICVFSILLAMVHAQNSTVGVGAQITKDGPELFLELERQSRKTNFKARGSTNFRGNWRAGVGIKRGNWEAGIWGSGSKGSGKSFGATVSWRFGRSTHNEKNPGYYDVWIMDNQCQFLMYDKNGDNLISRKEMMELFVESNLGLDIFNDLDTIKGDGGITKKEFYAMSPLIIKGCYVKSRG